MPTISTNSCQRRGVTHMRSAGVPTTGPGVQYGVHTDQKRVLERAFRCRFLLLFLFFVVVPRDTSKKRMPDRGYPPTTSANSGGCREVILTASTGVHKSASVVHFLPIAFFSRGVFMRDEPNTHTSERLLVDNNHKQRPRGETAHNKPSAGVPKSWRSAPYWRCTSRKLVLKHLS